MDINSLFKQAIEKEGSDIHLTVGLPPTMRLHGVLTPINGSEILTADETERLAYSILNQEQKDRFIEQRELDLSYFVEGLGRFRINLYWQQATIGMAIRSIPSNIPMPEDIGLSDEVVGLTKLKNGLVLVTGPTGSGKSTTLAALINHINTHSAKHILTIEDPIEFVYTNAQSMVNQREVGTDTHSFENALKSALREDPDIILVGEMRDLETISATLTIAETGHLAFATLHTINVSQTIDRIIDVFPPYQQQQIRMMLSIVLRGIICQQLLPKKNGDGRVAAREILFADMAIANMIREGQTPQIYSRIQTGGELGMQTFDNDIQRLFKEDLISGETAETYLVSHH